MLSSKQIDAVAQEAETYITSRLTFYSQLNQARGGRRTTAPEFVHAFRNVIGELAAMFLEGQDEEG